MCRMATAGVRYAVTITPKPTKGPKKAAKQARPKTYALHDDEDGWSGIQDAQNAAATRALYEVREDYPCRQLWCHGACLGIAAHLC